MRDPDAMVSDGVDYVTRINLYNLNFWMVVLIKKLYPGREFNFCHHRCALAARATCSQLGLCPSRLALRTYSWGFAPCGARCALAAGNTNCTS